MRGHFHLALCDAQASGWELYLSGAVTHCVEILEWQVLVQSLRGATVPKAQSKLQ